ncbi:MAG: DUF4258 domain-containing protein [Gemmataceae bacterium]|nr:DUF4258 domain-containing protein [Gemmataceae bacterium]MCI0740744.1 DUF4258 domain-containing protein [Gemmataceae bacterium]
MEIRFLIDPETELPHILDHGVSEDEVVEVLSNPLEDFQGERGARIALGKTFAGRTLQVIYLPDEEDSSSFFVITAYDLRGKALKALRRRQRKKRGR